MQIDASLLASFATTAVLVAVGYALGARGGPSFALPAVVVTSLAALAASVAAVPLHLWTLVYLVAFPFGHHLAAPGRAGTAREHALGIALGLAYAAAALALAAWPRDWYAPVGLGLALAAAVVAQAALAVRDLVRERRARRHA